MRKRPAQLISGLLHPLIVPSLGILLVFYSMSKVFYLPYEVQRAILLIVALNTMVLPIITFPILSKFGFIKSIYMNSHKERVLPLLFMLILYIFSFYFLARLRIFPILSLFMLGATFAVLTTFVVSIWWKISIHMVGIGGFTGLSYVLVYRFHPDTIWPLLVATLLAGLVAWARLELKAHKPSQVYSGFAVGAISIVGTLLWF